MNINDRKIIFIILALALSACAFFTIGSNSGCSNTSDILSSSDTAVISSSDNASSSDIVVTASDAVTAESTSSETSTTAETSSTISSSTSTSTTTTASDNLTNAQYVVNPNYESKYYIVVFAGSSQSVAVYGKDETGAYTVLVRCFTCSTGASSSPTRTGQYKIRAKYRWRWLVGDVYGQYSSSISSSYLFHSVPYLKQDPSTLDMVEYDKLGSPASHGCIRLCVRDSKWIYDNCPIGTQVNIVNASGPYGAGYPARNTDSIYNGWDPSDPAAANPYVNPPSTTTTTTTTMTTTTTITTDTTTTSTVSTSAATTQTTTTTQNTTVSTETTTKSTTTTSDPAGTD